LTSSTISQMYLFKFKFNFLEFFSRKEKWLRLRSAIEEHPSEKDFQSRCR
jgi:hypothetical protein